MFAFWGQIRNIINSAIINSALINFLEVYYLNDPDNAYCKLLYLQNGIRIEFLVVYILKMKI